MADDEAEPVAKHPRRDTPPVFVSKGCGHAAVVLFFFMENSTQCEKTCEKQKFADIGKKKRTEENRHPLSRSVFLGITFFAGTCFVENLGLASAPPGHQTPSSAWWRDAALERKSTSGASATGPVS